MIPTIVRRYVGCVLFAYAAAVGHRFQYGLDDAKHGLRVVIPFDALRERPAMVLPRHSAREIDNVVQIILFRDPHLAVVTDRLFQHL